MSCVHAAAVRNIRSVVGKMLKDENVIMFKCC